MSDPSTSDSDSIPNTYELMEAVEHCLMEQNDICLEKYLAFWRNVCKIMGSWGVIFSFIVKDVTEKLDKLKEMRDANNEGYETVLTMAATEASNGTIRNQKPNRSGTGHLMVLNRALEFVLDFLNDVFLSTDDSAKVYTMAKASYDRHLAKYHSWPVKKIASAALYALPNRAEFIARLRGTMPESQDAIFHASFVRNSREVINRVNQLVVQFELTDYNPSA